MKSSIARLGQHLAALAATASLGGCQGMPLSDSADTDTITNESKTVRINWRGNVVDARVAKDRLLVEGDVVVYPEDVVPIAECRDDVCTVAEAVRIQGIRYRWPGGVVPYAFDSTLSQANKDALVAAMRDWSSVIPGLTFREKTNSDTAWNNFVKDSDECSSGVGKPSSGANTIRLTSGCIGSYAAHHEIGHALGLYHQHTRKDRDDFVTINWANIKGCRSTATSSSQCGPGACSGALADCGCTDTDVAKDLCYMAGNFATNNARADIGEYDYDSVMHYSARAFAKSAGQTTIATPAGAPAIGQSDHFSAGDVLAMNTMYPVAHQVSAVFAGSGDAEVCSLDGRRQDVYSEIRVTVDGSTSSGMLDTNELAPSTEVDVSCSIRSVYWASSYDYPNYTVNSPAISTFSSSSIESYSSSSKVAVLDLGLVPALL